MRSIPGTITDPAMDRIIDPLAYYDSIIPDEPLSLDLYQERAASTAIYPRVYTEDQVHDIALDIALRYADDVDQDLIAYIDSDIKDALDNYETPFNRLVYPILGLAGEAGELCNKLKKVARDDKGLMYPDKADEMADELGDIGWYFAAVATGLKRKLSTIAGNNINKLFSRKERGVLGGSGDKR